jgi:MFS family permease
VRRTARAVWGLAALAVIIVVVVVIAGAFRAHGNSAFNRWGVWAAIAAVPLAGLPVVLALWDKIIGSTDKPELDPRAVEDELAIVVLGQAQTTRARLIGTDQAEDQPANLRYARSAGRYREVGGARVGDLASILSYYQSLSPRRLVVLGDPGAGKTVLALELQVRLLEARRHDPAAPVPVLVSASAYDTGQDWDDWLARHLILTFSIPERTATRLVRDRRILPIIDGLDEMDPAGQPPDRAQALASALNAAMHGHQRAAVVVTCRHREYQALPHGVVRATHIEMTPLDSSEAAAYLREQFRTPGEEQRWEPALATLAAHPHGPLAQQLATPWRLTLALAAYRDNGDPAALIPPAGPTPDQYAQQADSLLLERYVPSAVRLHAPGTPYTEAHVHKWLTDLADGLTWQSRHGQSATDITLHQWWQPTGRRAIPLAHTVVAALPALALLTYAAITGQPGPLIVGGCLFVIALLGGTSPTPRRLNVRHIATRRGLRSLALGLAGGLAVGIALGLAFGIAGGLAVAFGLAGGLALGLAGGLAVGLALALDDPSPQAHRPREVIEANGVYGLAVGLAVVLAFGLAGGLAVGLAGGLAVGIAGGLAVGLAVGLAAGLGYFADAWTRYHVTAAVNAVRGRAPLRFGAFLDWAVQAGLLRVSGISYQFRHRQLQDWLTSPSQDPGPGPA